MLHKLLEELRPTNARLVAVTKNHSPEDILTLYRQGHRDFGENRVQELLPKWEALPKDIRWHAIGRLQTNKVKFLAPFIYMIHSVDSFKLLLEINKQAEKAGRVIPCLLQLHLALEETKAGMNREELFALLRNPKLGELAHVDIQGLMTMATFTDDMEQVRSEFAQLRAIFREVKENYFPERASFRELSMGMSGDYKIALEEGSTLVRIGSLLFT